MVLIGSQQQLRPQALACRSLAELDHALEFHTFLPAQVDAIFFGHHALYTHPNALLSTLNHPTPLLE
jgi:hypothetical protein